MFHILEILQEKIKLSHKFPSFADIIEHDYEKHKSLVDIEAICQVHDKIIMH
jgi:hypothetical protein